MKIWFVIFVGFILLGGCTTNNQKEVAPSVKSNLIDTANDKPRLAKAPALTKAQKDSINADSIAENIISDSLFSLPKIKKFAHQLSKDSHDSLYVEIMFNAPTKKAPYYWAHVGYATDDVFQVPINFKVKIEGKRIIEIKSDLAADDTLGALATWGATRDMHSK